MKYFTILISVFSLLLIASYISAISYVKNNAIEFSSAPSNAEFCKGYLSDIKKLNATDEARNVITSSSHDLHEFLTHDKKACLIDYGFDSNALDAETLITHSYYISKHAKWLKDQDKAIYFLNLPLKNHPNHPLSEHLIKPELGRLLIKRKASKNDIIEGHLLIKESIMFPSMVAAFLHAEKNSDEQKLCLQKAGILNLVKTNTLSFRTPILLVKTSKWLRDLCLSSTKNLNDLSQKYKEGKTLPQSDILAKYLHESY